jgi:uncharacterized damage-inducible protein DinB
MNAEQGKFLVEYLARLWETEFPATCKVIAAVPDAKGSYKPDEKSRTAWQLTTHLASADIWFLDSIIKGSFVFNPEDAKKEESRFANVAAVVDFYKQTFPQKLNAVRQLPPEKLTEIIDFFGFFKWPNVEYLGFAQNHSVHHRGQLASYLRAMGSKVPAIYGASADEPMMANA